MLYDFLDGSKLFRGTVRKEDRSLMNVPFVTPSKEQDADVVMLLYKETDTPDSRRVLFIAKNKEGEQGKIYLAFDGAHQSFAPLSGQAYMNKLKNDAQRKKAERREETRKAQVNGQVRFAEVPESGDEPF